MEFKLTDAFFGFRKEFLLIIMKSFIFLLCTTVFGLSTDNVLSQSSKITIDENKIVTVDEVFKIISAQTDYRFIYQSDMFNEYPKVALKKGIIKTNKLLEKSLSNGEFDFNFTSKNTIIIQKVEPNLQQLTINGTVTDESGLPIAGATVVISSKAAKDQNLPSDILNATVTNINGSFSTKAAQGNYIIVSTLGFNTQSQLVTSISTYNITLKERASILDEVVIVGYGSQRREEVSSAISSVKGEKVVQSVIGNASFDRGLSGLIKGVQIQQNTARPGEGVDINIRGITSPFTGSDNNPLFVIDGVPFQVSSNTNSDLSTRLDFITPANPLLSINPNDIESIDVLKDAAATSIYGSRGANGVIIVKTKIGKRQEKMQVSVSAQTSFGEPIGTLDYANAQEFRDFSEAYVINSVEAANAGQISPFGLLFGIADIDLDFATFQSTYNGLNPDYFGNADTNWADVVYRNKAVSNRYDVSITGGGQQSSYLLSLGYLDQEGLLRADELKQYNLRVGFDSNVNKALKVGVSTNLSYTNNFSGYGTVNNFLNRQLNVRPDFPVRDDNGDYIYPSSRFRGFFDQEDGNPLAFTTENSIGTKSYNLIGNVYAELQVIKNLKVRGQLNGSYFFTDRQTYAPAFASEQAIVPLFFPPNPRSSDNSRANIEKAISSSIVTDLTATYTNSFGDHNVSALFGFSWQRDISDRSSVSFQGFPDDQVLTTITNAARLERSLGGIIETGLNSYFTRISYNYKNKYYANLSLRRDRSSRFGPDNQNAFFPAFSANWTISKENFLKDSKVVNSLKLRTSIGEVGSVNIGDYRYIQFFEQGSGSDFNYVGLPAIGLSNSLVNPDIRWETTRDFNIGLDYGLFNNRIYGSLDVYDRQTDGALLINPPFPRESGLTNFTANFADLSNRGIEFEIFGDILRTNDFKWSLGFNISKNETKLERFNSETLNQAEFTGPFELGREPGLIRGFIVEGIFQEQTEIDNLNTTAIANNVGSFYQTAGTSPGDYKYRDINGDGVINDEDIVILGSPQADFFGGFNSVIQYKGFELSAIFNFSKGSETIINGGGQSPLYPDFGKNVERRFSQPYRWSPTNTDATLPRLVSGDPNFNSRTSSENVFDSSYMRLRNLQLKYNFSPDVIEKIGVSNLSFFISGSNLWTITDFPGVDPEGAGRIGSGALFGQDTNAYPNSKSWSIGLNVNF